MSWAELQLPLAFGGLVSTVSQRGSALLLPLLAGGGWEGVKPLRKRFGKRFLKYSPLPSPPLLAGEGVIRHNPFGVIA
jgi:hypothetical protein